MTDHKEIWLEPECPNCGDQGGDRQWCQDDVWHGDTCDGCGAKLKSVRYERTE